MTPRTTIGNLDNSQWMVYAVNRTKVSLGNCFTYATARISEIVGYNQSLDGATRVAGAGQLWAIHDKAYSQSAIPVEGALAIFQGLVYGHVAVVEKVEGNHIWISESNYGDNTDSDRDGVADGFRYLKTSGVVGYSYVGTPGLKLVGFLIHKDLKSSGGTKNVNGDIYSAAITEASPIIMNASSERSKIDRIIIHHTATTNEGVALNTWRKGAPANTSANYLITSSKIIGCVGENFTAWHCGNWEMNKRSIGIEHLNNTGAPSWTIAEETYRNSAKLIADISKRHNIPIDDKHIIPHKSVFATACPGGIDMAKLIRMTKEVVEGEKVVVAKKETTTKSNSFRVRVSVSDLRLRNGAGLSAKVLKSCPRGVYTITETKTANGLEWGKLKSGAGWIALKYTTKL